jgi:hypothetical protein
VITPRRLVYIGGIRVRKVATMPLSDVEDVRLHRSPLGLLLGYGVLIVEPKDPDSALRKIRYVPYPVQIHLEISEWLFPSDSPDDGA